MRTPTVEIFSQGEEVISGQVVDTNAAWLSQQLLAMGAQPARHTVVGDHLPALTGLLQEIAGRSDCCICSGGLGPTVDDLTAEAVAAAFNQPLTLDPFALQQIETCFQRAGRTMSPSNRKQALLPQGVERLDNHWGTAPGFTLKAQQCRFFFLPGVPYEMRQMFAACVRPALLTLFPQFIPQPQVTLRSLGIGESALQDRLNQLDWPDHVQLGFRSLMPEVQTKLHFSVDYPTTAIADFSHQVAQTIGPAVFSIDGLPDTAGGDLSTVIGRYLSSRCETLALAETFSSGRAAAQCSGAIWFAGGFVAGSTNLLGKALSLAGIPANSAEQEAGLLAQAARERFDADYGIAQVPAPPDSADDLEYTRICHALATEDRVYLKHDTVRGTPTQRQIMASATLLDLLRRYSQCCL